jgi:DUF1365 family protein
MGLNSCLYECAVMHNRLEPKKNKFAYNIFMFYLDLDEVDLCHQKLSLFSHNRWNVFSFREKDHMEPGPQTLKENILDYVRSQGVDLPGGKVTLLTHVRTFGYIFNPVSFYYCFTPSGLPACAVVEVENTFREQKRYFLRPNTFQNDRFILRTLKHFYVSPFIKLDAEFEFKLPIPGENLTAFVDDFEAGHKFLLTSLAGTRAPLSDASLIWFLIKYPFITLKVIGLIHWQALILSLKGIPYFKKAANPQLQREIYHAKSHS